MASRRWSLPVVSTCFHYSLLPLGTFPNTVCHQQMLPPACSPLPSGFYHTHGYSKRRQFCNPQTSTVISQHDFAAGKMSTTINWFSDDDEVLPSRLPAKAKSVSSVAQGSIVDESEDRFEADMAQAKELSLQEPEAVESSDSDVVVPRRTRRVLRSSRASGDPVVQDEPDQPIRTESEAYDLNLHTPGYHKRKTGVQRVKCLQYLWENVEFRVVCRLAV